MYKYKTAITRNVAYNLAKEGQRINEAEVNFEKVQKEHEYYKQVLSENGIKVLNIAADESLPDCVFTEDPLVVHGNQAMLTTLGHPARMAEKNELKKLINTIPGIEVFEMSLLDKDAKLDGGDVLNTGTDMFIGVSSRTNQAAIQVMKKCFKDLQVHAIPVSDGLHLKSCMTMAGPDTIICSTYNQGTRAIIQEVKKHATKEYKYLEVDINPKNSNVIYFETAEGSVLLHPVMKSAAEKEALNLIKADKKIEVDVSELNKVDGCLTCCSVLLTI